MRIKEARMRMRDIERGKMPWTIPLHRRLEIIRLGERSGIPATNRIGNIVPRIFKPVFSPKFGRTWRNNKRPRNKRGGNREIRIKEISHNISFIRL